MSRQCLEPLLQYGQQAMEDNKQQRCTYALEQVVLAVIVTTGLVSILVTREHTADYNSGLAHGIFYAMTTLPEFEKDHLHGAVVGFGVLLLLLCDGQLEEFERLYQFNRAVGLPVSLQELQITPEQMEALYPLIPQNQGCAALSLSYHCIYAGAGFWTIGTAQSARQGAVKPAQLCHFV